MVSNFEDVPFQPFRATIVLGYLHDRLNYRPVDVRKEVHPSFPGSFHKGRLEGQRVAVAVHRG